MPSLINIGFLDEEFFIIEWSIPRRVVHIMLIDNFTAEGVGLCNHHYLVLLSSRSVDDPFGSTVNLLVADQILIDYCISGS